VDRLIYTAVTGMNASMNRQRVIANNMANAQTIGFRAETMQFEPMTLKGQQIEVRAMVSGEVQGADMKGGALNQTGRDLDVAVTGQTMLTVQAADGGEGYTRRGDLTVSASGVLQNGEGFPMIGESGPITVPTGARIAIAPDGAVMATNPEAPDQPPVQVAKLKLASFAGSTIRKDLDGLFRVPGGGVLPADDSAKVTPGALEGSNVDTSQVLVEMIEAQRLYDMRTKLIATARDMDEGGARLMQIT
jgi:flagellar basal-body rod protein FlgF